MKYALFIFLNFFCFQKILASDSLSFIKSIEIEANLFTTDASGNIYIVRHDNLLTRYNSNGDSIASFQEIKKGRISQIDATNPLRILVFFSDFGQIVILDKQLSQKSVLKLPAMGILNVPCIANSADGGIWIFDPILGNLMKNDENPTVMFTTPLRNILDKPLNPCYMIEQDRNLYIVDSVNGIKRFDLYGFFMNEWPVKTTEVQCINSYLIYYTAPYFYSYHIPSFKENKISLPFPESIRQVRTERNKLYILRNNQLDIYNLPDKS